KETRGNIYARGEGFLQVDDIYAAGFAPCYLETLEKFQARAYINVPIFQGDKLWGLMAAYQNSAPRHWEEWEVESSIKLSNFLGIALQQAEALQQVRASSEKLAASAAREQELTKIVSRLLRGSLENESIFQITTQDIRHLLKVDRVALYKYNSDWSGYFVAESVASGWSRLLDTMPVISDSHLQETQGGRYRLNDTLAVNDIYTAGHSPCHVELLEQMEARAYAIVPVFVNQKLWGLLGVYQNSAPRVWEEAEISTLAQIGIQVGAALKQTEYVEQVRKQSEQLTQIAQREKETKEQLQQQAIQLLLAVRPALSGDLTVRAPITDDEVGTIADAYNNTLQSLRRTVTQLQAASGTVVQTCQGSESNFSALATQAQEQLQSLNRALEQIQVMVNSCAVVASDAQQVELAAQRANQIVRQGDAAMNRTVDGILAIRETVTETSKLIKRLSQSSQKISGVVNSIGNFTTQTQLLALNASIEATRAGEYGRGFAVVADEVRSLARQSAAANTEIGKLVQEIQAGTALVSKAMETGIQQVVTGTNLVNETRSSLNAIVEATAEIGELVEGITGATGLQTQQSQSVTQSMNEVANIANKTSVDSMQLAAAFKELLTMAQDLQASVAKFKVE
ncbi:MAG TPA: chemotaxis protein, partial [Cyanobacteria bacterium UBA11049]|nr:chemotaxis protein [Cyanobacteria bacterium UBA11049]